MSGTVQNVPPARETAVEEAARILAEWDARAMRLNTEYDGGILAWRSWGTGSPVVLLHGNSGSWTHWIRNLEALSARHRLYVPDLPGHGDSSNPEAPTSMRGIACQLWQGLDDLLPGQQVDLAGFSLGSVIAESMAVERPERVRRLVLLRGSFGTGPARLPDNLVRWRDLEDPADMAAAQRHNLSVLMFHDAARIDALAVHLHTQNLLRCALDMKPLLASRSPETFKRLTGHIHGIAGEFDVYGGNDAAAQERALIATHPHAGFTLIRSTGHWANYEAADVVNARLLEILA